MKLFQVVCASLLLLSGCASVTPEDYRENTPTFDIRNYLNGKVEAYGMFVDNAGKADPMFKVALKGTWHGNSGVLDEHFTYNDGHTQDRKWSITFTDDHHFSGTAADIVGTATGSQYGNAVNIKYILMVPTDSGDTYDMSMDDWLYQMSDDLVLNRNEMRKFGIKIGTLIISFHKIKP